MEINLTSEQVKALHEFLGEMTLPIVKEMGFDEKMDATLFGIFLDLSGKILDEDQKNEVES